MPNAGRKLLRVLTSIVAKRGRRSPSSRNQVPFFPLRPLFIFVHSVVCLLDHSVEVVEDLGFSSQDPQQKPYSLQQNRNDHVRRFSFSAYVKIKVGEGQLSLGARGVTRGSTAVPSLYSGTYRRRRQGLFPYPLVTQQAGPLKRVLAFPRLIARSSFYEQNENATKPLSLLRTPAGISSPSTLASALSPRALSSFFRREGFFRIPGAKESLFPFARKKFPF